MRHVGITIDAGRAARALAVLVVVLSIAGLAAQYATWVLDRYAFGLVELFDPVGEGNVPALASTLLLATCALLSLTAAAGARLPGVARDLRALAALFAIFTIDEACSLHEKAGTELGDALGRGGVYAWMIPGALAVIAGIAYALRRWMRLPTALRRSLAVGMSVFLGSALLLEGVEAALERGFAWGVVATLQETGELTGISILVVGLLRWIGESGARVTLSVAQEDGGAGEALSTSEAVAPPRRAVPTA